MPRVRRGFKARRRRNKVLKAARGYYSSRGRSFTSAVQQVRSAWQDAYAHRRQNKRNYRRLWIARINAAAREHGLSYSKLMAKLNASNIELNRKVLADLALRDPGGFRAVVDAANA